MAVLEGWDVFSVRVESLWNSARRRCREYLRLGKQHLTHINIWGQMIMALASRPQAREDES